MRLCTFTALKNILVEIMLGSSNKNKETSMGHLNKKQSQTQQQQQQQQQPYSLSQRLPHQLCSRYVDKRYWARQWDTLPSVHVNSIGIRTTTTTTLTSTTKSKKNNGNNKQNLP